MAKVDSMQEQMGNIGGEVEILRKNQKEMLEIKSIVPQMKNAFDGLISRLDTAVERISYLEDISIETSKTEKQREQGLEKKKQNRISKDCGTTTKGVTCLMGTLEGDEREKGTKEIYETIMTENFPKLMSDTNHQTPGSSKNTKQDKYSP